MSADDPKVIGVDMGREPDWGFQQRRHVPMGPVIETTWTCGCGFRSTDRIAWQDHRLTHKGAFVFVPDTRATT